MILNNFEESVKTSKSIFPKISLITPSFNQGSFIEETILSVLNQNYPNLEYIIIDGGSDDNTLEIIKKYESRLTYWISEKDEGQSDAINKGFKKCSGEIVSWLNSDDLLAKHALHEISNAFVKYNAQIIVGKSSHWDGTTNLLTPHVNNPETFKDLLSYNNGICLPQPSVFYRRVLLIKADYLSITLNFTMDLDLWLRFGLIEGINNRIIYIPHLVSLMRTHKDQKTSKQNFLAMKEASMVTLKYASKYKLNIKARINLLFKNRIFRYNKALHNKNKYRLLDVFLISKMKKFLTW